MQSCPVSVHGLGDVAATVVEPQKAQKLGRATLSVPASGSAPGAVGDDLCRRRLADDVGGGHHDAPTASTTFALTQAVGTRYSRPSLMVGISPRLAAS
jgi:hypothetical protein